MPKTRTLATAAVALVLCAACTSNSTVSKTPVTVASVAGSSHAAPAATKHPVAHVGSTIALEDGNGMRLRVTLVKVAPSTTSNNQFETPDAGMRWFAAQFRLVNAGTAAYDDSPENGAKAIDAESQQYQTTFVDSLTAGPLLPADTRIAPGDSALGWIVFQVPKTARITGVQFALESGFGAAGQWAIP